jgi:hypothetical protein
MPHGAGFISCTCFKLEGRPDLFDTPGNVRDSKYWWTRGT